MTTHFVIPAEIRAKVAEIMASNTARYAGHTMRLSDALAGLHQQRAALEAEIDGMIAAPLPEDAAEARAANEAITARSADLVTLNERIRLTEESETRRAADAAMRAQANGGDPDAATGRPPVLITHEPRAYDDPRRSYFLDLVRDQLSRGDGDGGVLAARERLQRHAQELAVELPSRQQARDNGAHEQAEREMRGQGIKRRSRETMFEKRVNPNRADGQGGFFVPPLWLVDEYVDLPRFGRTTANLCRQMALPSGTDSINLPKVATGTTAGSQTDNGAVSSTDLTDTSVSAPVRTIAGQQDIALQLLDQSPVSFDEVVFADLIADYNAQLDTQVINGAGTGGTLTGILNTAGINAVTYTDATPTLPELWVPLLQSASLVAKGRKVGAATGVVMTPSQWYWALSQLDTTNRPLIVPSSVAMNPMGDAGLLEADGPAGVLTYGLPAFLDGNIPTNLGAGTNESRVITARWQDLFLWEGSMRTRVLQEVLSGTLQVRLQVYNYVAFMANRRPSSISVISGTGLVAPSGF